LQELLKVGLRASSEYKLSNAGAEVDFLGLDHGRIRGGLERIYQLGPSGNGIRIIQLVLRGNRNEAAAERHQKPQVLSAPFEPYQVWVRLF